MFRFIFLSWATYGQVVLTLVSVYYLVVLALFFRYDISRWWVHKRRPGRMQPDNILDKRVPGSPDSNELANLSGTD